MINLLPTDEKKAIRTEYYWRVLTVCSAMFFLVLLVMVFSFLPTYFFTISRYGAFLSESQSDEIQSQISQVKEMDMAIQETNRKIDLLKNGASSSRVKDVFWEILQSKNKGVALTAFSYDSGSLVSKNGNNGVVSPANIQLQGVSSDRESLLAFKDALAQKKEFKTIDLPLSSLVKDTNLSFSINISLASIAP
jgi:hypothetical protein